MSRQSDVMHRLLNNEIVDNYKEGGNSMTPLIKSRQPIKLEPVINKELKVNDMVFCKVAGNFYTHKITAIKNDKGRFLYQISNNHKYVNGWIPKTKIYGIVTKVY